MRNKAPLVLMEQLVMLLVFSLAAAACLGIFAGAQRIRQQTRQQDAAVVLAQEAAEVLRHTSGDLHRAAPLLQGSVSGNRLTADRENGLRIRIEKTASDIPGLGTAALHITREDAVILAVDIAWQEVP